MCLPRQVSSVLPRDCRNDPWPGEDEAWFVTVNFMARQLHGLSDVNTEIEPSSEIRREAGTATTRIPVLGTGIRHVQGRVEVWCRPPIRLLSQLSERSRAALHRPRRVDGDVGHD